MDFGKLVAEFLASTLVPLLPVYWKQLAGQVKCCLCI